MKGSKLLLLLLFIMAAEGVLSVGVKEFNVGRAFAHCTKLSKSNYDVWLTGLISTLVGITGISSLRDVRKFFEYFEDSRRAGQQDAKIEENLKQLLDQVLKLEANKEDDDGDTDAEDKTDEKEVYKRACNLMFTIIQSTIARNINCPRQQQCPNTEAMGLFL